jgi:hypothetical protein
MPIHGGHSPFLRRQLTAPAMQATQLAAEMAATACNARKLAEEQQHNACLYVEDADRATLQSKYHGSLVKSFHARGYSMSENCIQAEVSAARCDWCCQLFTHSPVFVEDHRCV